MKLSISQIGTHGMCLCVATLLASCSMSGTSAGSQRSANAEALDLQQFLILTAPPEIAAYTANDVPQMRRKIAGLRPAQLQEREGSQVESANALPFLTGSAIGRKFLSTDRSRVLVRGAPREFCPTALVESGSASVSDLTASALSKCLNQSSEKCGCEVVAAGSVLLVPRTEVNYATAIAARVRAPSLGIDGFLVAEEDVEGNVLLRDLTGVVGQVERGDADRVTVILGSKRIAFQGRSIEVGFRRGRLAERIYAKDDGGNRLALLIGFDPTELASLAGAWLAWPKGG